MNADVEHRAPTAAQCIAGTQMKESERRRSEQWSPAAGALSIKNILYVVFSRCPFERYDNNKFSAFSGCSVQGQATVSERNATCFIYGGAQTRRILKKFDVKAVCEIIIKVHKSIFKALPIVWACHCLSLSVWWLNRESNVLVLMTTVHTLDALQHKLTGNALFVFIIVHTISNALHFSVKSLTWSVTFVVSASWQTLDTLTSGVNTWMKWVRHPAIAANINIDSIWIRRCALAAEWWWRHLLREWWRPKSQLIITK